MRFVSLCSLGAVLVWPALVAGQTSCPSKPVLAFQASKQARLVTPDTGDSPRMTKTPHPSTAVQFVVDTAGTPVKTTIRAFAMGDTALYQAFVRELPKKRFEPARMADGCVVSQVVMAGLEWPARR